MNVSLAKESWPGGVVRPAHRGAAVRIVLCALLAAMAPGCAARLPAWVSDGWVADYDSAEARVRELQRPLLIFYRDTERSDDGNMHEALQSIDRLSEDYVLCMLFRSYEPDRRYVAQYGVDRAPALIVVHRDGTFHAQSGLMEKDDLATFLADATPPGAEPRPNPHIPRRPQYAWHTSLDEAQEAARAAGRPLCVVVYRSLSRDWARMKRILKRHEVFARLGSMVHCRIGVLSAPAHRGEHQTPFGPLKLPAMVIVKPDADPQTLEHPTSYEAVVRFIDAGHRESSRRARKVFSPSRAKLQEDL